MAEQEIAYLIFLVIATACSYTSGKREGISTTLDYMKSNGHIDFEEQQKIVLDFRYEFWYNIQQRMKMVSFSFNALTPRGWALITERNIGE